MIQQNNTKELSQEQQQANEDISLLLIYKPRANKISQEINDLIRGLF